MEQEYSNDYLQGFNNANSSWIDSIDRNEPNEDSMVIATIIYSDKISAVYKVYVCYFWVSLEEYYALLYATSQGSHYLRLWSVYGVGKEWYNGQDKNANKPTTSDENESTSSDKPTTTTITPNSISQEDFEEAIKSQQNGEYDEWIKKNMSKYSDEDTQNFSDMIDQIQKANDLYERTLRMRDLLQREKMTLKQIFKQTFRDIEAIFGVSIEGRIKNLILNQVSDGILTPQKIKKYQYKMKQIYDAMERDGIRGISKIGRRMLNAKNPLVRNRNVYKAKEVIKSAYKKSKTKTKYYSGNEALKEIEKFHKKTIKQEATGIIKRNSSKLEVKVLKDGSKVMYWKKDVSFGRKIIIASKKILKLLKFFI